MASSRLALCFRILTIILAILIWIIGGAILAFSIYLRVDYWINQYVQASSELQAYSISVYVFIATGACIIVFCIVGIYGAARPDKCALIVYTIFLPILLCALIGGGVYAYVYREEIENTVKNSNTLLRLVQEKYGNDARVTHSINFMQKELMCCGGIAYTDYLESFWANDYTSEKPEERKNMAPLTCCKDYKRYEDIPITEYRYCPIYTSDANQIGNPLKDINPNINRKGCGEAFVDFFQEHIKTAAAICFTIVGLLFLAIVFAALTLFHLRKAPVSREDDVVYEMARTQEKSPYPARGTPYANLYQS
ncbi:tetraspanin-1-like isoform X31 [Dreissena polymorpha]|uniref:Tetraspanin n=1 Tax=Dreissena polymorpha TaxID=45954 RepID=A0A9D4S0F9_DREPO|nr:tetraspanin-1-like isoform X31 [Dreissena polymorpha]KAH3887864.1 hypothetical protein DPMN_011886 [Dreissena polymorpha]